MPKELRTWANQRPTSPRRPILVPCHQATLQAVRLLLDAAYDESALTQLLGLAPEDIDPALLDLEAPFTCRRRGVEIKIVAGERQPTPDPALVRALRNAHRWAAMLKSGAALNAIADREGLSKSYLTRIIPLATLSPKIQEAVVAGAQPLELTLETLVRARLPLDWTSQEKCFGFTA